LNGKQLQNYLEYYSFVALLKLLKLLPYRASCRIICVLFRVIGYGLGIRRAVAECQLRKVYPDWSARQIQSTIKELYRQMALNISEVYLKNDQDLFGESRIVGREHVDAALGMQRGAILATAHMGNWEAARILPLYGIAVSVITKKQRNRLFDRYTNSIRERNGVHTIDMKRGLRDIITDLKQNRLVAILADQNAGSAGLVQDFLGYPASHWKGVAKLSLRYKIPIVPGFVIRDEKDLIRFEFSDMLYYPDLEDEPLNYELVIRDIARITEEYIHRYPEQWFWVHKRWKHAYNMFE